MSDSRRGVPGVRIVARSLFIVAIGLLALVGTLPIPARADYTDGVQAAQKTSMEAGIRLWRKSGWLNDDFLSEIKLGDIYGDERGDNRYYDPIEAYVWYFLASHSGRMWENNNDPFARRIVSNNLSRSFSNQQKLLLLMSGDDRADARNRIIYILSCRGADGMLALGRIHMRDHYDYNSPWRRGGWQSDNWDTFNAFSDMADSERDFHRQAERRWSGGDAARARQSMGIPSNSVIVQNDGEALMYFHVADNMGQPLAREYLRGLDGAVRSQPGWGARVAQEASEKARYWSPQFEFYPAGDSTSGLPYTDECYVNFDRSRALQLVSAGLPAGTVHQALRFLGWNAGGDLKGIQKYQVTIADSPTGVLTAPEAVRLVQTAAIQGDASSQNTLGVMYAKGIGVVRNYARAKYWFEKAGAQRYGAALYHLGVLYKVGPDGVKQDLSKANDYFTASALAGFRPTLNQLSELLARAAYAPPRPGDH